MQSFSRETGAATNEADEQLRLALDAGAIVGTWVWDIPQDRIVADERFATTFGLDAAKCRAGMPLADAKMSIHPDDIERVNRAIAATMHKGGPYRCEYRVLQGDNRYRWIEANGRCDLAPDGTPLRFPGVLLDIEDRRRAESERDEANVLLRTFMEAVPGVVYAKDRAGRLVLGNAGTAALLGRSPSEFIGRTDAELLADPEQAAAIMATDRRIMETGQLEQLEEEVRLADGSPAYWLSTKSPLRNADGEVIGLIGSSLDITERKREQERARNEAEMLEVLNRTGILLAGELDLEKVLQSVTDAATRLTGAKFGAFFYNGIDASSGEAYLLYTLSGAPREAFSSLGHPRPTAIFEPTFRGGPPLRLHDVQQDPRYGQWGPHHGQPQGHLPVRSYLAVSVVLRSGEVAGGLFFGHPEPGVFTERSERLAVGIAGYASIAIDNARLFAEAQRAAQDREQLLASERAARAEAERASTLKDEFLATLSHELRTPLSAILGWVHILRNKAGADPTVAKGVDIIERSTKVQTQLIEDLLDMSRITSGKLALDLQPVAPVALVLAAVESLRPTAEAARVRLRTEVEGTGASVMADAARLQQVVWNMLSNAIKFSPPEGEVLVRVGGGAHHVRIEVRDEGIGIAPEFLPHVFERFRQEDGSITRVRGGLGLGLSIVRHLVEMHGGTVTAHSAGKGRGARFEVLLPAFLHASPLASPEVGADAAGSLAGVPILVVDDEPTVLDLLTRVLGEAHADVIPVSSAQAALDAFGARRPALVISDLGLPGVDGFELLRLLRRREDGGSRVPVLALTAFARPEDRKRAIDAGFDAYLSKPVQIRDLLAQAGALVGTRLR
jgi:PAS domain S-box-containing protein